MIVFPGVFSPLAIKMSSEMLRPVLFIVRADSDKNPGEASSIVWGLGFWLGKDILGFYNNIGFDNS